MCKNMSEKKELTPKETDRLRSLYWKLQEAQGELNNALNETALSHKLDIEREQWNVSQDFKFLVRIK